MNDLLEEIEFLKKEIKRLREEKRALVERAEDIHLLGLVSERVSRAQSDREVVEAVLEKICLMRDIDYAAYLYVTEGKVNILDERHSSDIKPQKALVIDAQEELFKTEPVFIDFNSVSPVPKVIPSSVNGITPKACYIVPLMVQDTLCGHLLFVNYSADADYLQGLIHLINRACEIACSRIETISLMEEINDLKEHLERLVEEKTNELKVVNFEFQLELEDKRRVEERLRLFRDLINQSNDAIYVIDPVDSKFLDINDRAASDLGYSRSELMSLSVINVQENIGDIDSWKRFVKAVQDKGYMLTEIILRRKDGTTFPVELNIKHVKHTDRDYLVAVARDITERKRAEEALRESEEKFRSLAENASCGVFIYRDRLIYVNPATEKITGYSSEELLRMNLFELIHPDYIEEVKQRVQARLKGETVSKRYICKIIRKDGQERWIDFTSERFIYKGKPAAIGTGYDITELKEFEERIGLYKKIFDNSNDAIAIISPECTYIEQNKAHQELIGYTDDELIGKTPAVHLGVEVFEKIAERLRKEGFYRGEVISKTKSGKAIFLDLAAFPVKNPDGKTICYVGIKRDVSDRKRIEEALKESEERLKAIFENSEDGILVADMETKRLIMGNKKIARMTGYSLEELQTLSVMDLHPRESLDFILEQFNKQARKEITLARDIPVKRKDGSIFYADINSFPIKLQGKAYLVGFFRDITEWKKTLEELKRSEASLAEAQRIAHFGNWDWDIKNNRLRWSDEVYRIFGLKPQEFGATYEAFLNSVHPDDRGFVQRSVDEALYKGKPYKIDHRIVLPDGTIRIVHEEAEVTLDEDGRPIRMIGTVQDITERKLAEEELRRYREHLESLVEERTFELKKVVNLMAGREVRMSELKEMIRQLREQIKAAGLTPVVDDPLSEEA